jgi:hypothetical protein
VRSRACAGVVLMSVRMRLHHSLGRKTLESLRATVRQSRTVREDLRALIGAMVQGHNRWDSSSPLGEARPFGHRVVASSSPEFPLTVSCPEDGHYMTTFFDVSPFSPSGRYLVVTQVPFTWRLPYPGDTARVCVIDLHDRTSTPIYETRGWGAQLGANVQWGKDDDTVVCNDLIDNRGVGIAIDRRTLQARRLEGPIYGLSPDRRYSFSADLQYVNAGIPGYGVPEHILDKRRPSAPCSTHEGIWRTDLETGKSELFLSISDIVTALPKSERLSAGVHYAFNVKVNGANSRLLIVMFARNVPGRMGWPTQLVTCDLDGSNVRLALPDRMWRKGGHHPNWTPDGDHILMNLRLAPGAPLSFVRFRYDGTDMEELAPGHKGSGHPSLHPSARWLMADAYVRDGFTDSKGLVPIRLIDLERNAESEIARVYTNELVGPRRVDPHPVWSDAGDRVCFNGLVNGRRQIFVADTSRLSWEALP